MFHIGLLKPYHGEAPSGSGALSTIHHGCACLKLAKVVKSRLARGHHEVLVQWMGLSAADASWVDLDEFRKLYPTFQLEDELVIEGGCHVCVCVCVGGGGGSPTPVTRRKQSQSAGMECALLQQNWLPARAQC
jgi:hypothetical protein